MQKSRNITEYRKIAPRFRYITYNLHFFVPLNCMDILFRISLGFVQDRFCTEP